MAKEIFVGIDLSKDYLEVAVRPGGECYTTPHTSQGIAQLVRQLVSLPA
jgi:hypothetical protein